MMPGMAEVARTLAPRDDDVRGGGACGFGTDAIRSRVRLANGCPQYETVLFRYREGADDEVRRACDELLAEGWSVACHKNFAVGRDLGPDVEGLAVTFVRK